jgi:hypothetical protein
MRNYDVFSAHHPQSPRGSSNYFLGISKATLLQWSVMQQHEVSCLHAMLDVVSFEIVGYMGFI